MVGHVKQSKKLRVEKYNELFRTTVYLEKYLITIRLIIVMKMEEIITLFFTTFDAVLSLIFKIVLAILISSW